MNPDLLTSVLQNNGHLNGVVVTNLSLELMDTNGLASNFYIAHVRYSSGDHALPERMIVKRPSLSDRGRGEAEVYEHILNRTNHGQNNTLPILTCYGIVDEDPDKGLCFFFDDHSESHHQTTWPIVPNLVDCKAAVSTLAKIHANWWGRVDSFKHLTPPVLSHQMPEHLATYFAKFVDFVGDYLSPQHIRHYEKVFTQLDKLIENRVNNSNKTLLHTDPHFWNFLYPNLDPDLDTENPQRNECIIFDWPLWRAGLAGCDLAYMIGLHLYPEHRQRFEKTLLNRYWQTLNEGNVNYDREDVQIDYRIGIINGLLMPVMEFSWDIPPLDWMPKLEKALSAYDDLNCAELLDSV